MSGADEEEEEEAQGRGPATWKVVLFAAVFVIVAALVFASDGEHQATARHFLRNLLRQLF